MLQNLVAEQMHILSASSNHLQLHFILFPLFVLISRIIAKSGAIFLSFFYTEDAAVLLIKLSWNSQRTNSTQRSAGLYSVSREVKSGCGGLKRLVWVIQD